MNRINNFVEESLKLPQLRQLGFVVREIREAMNEYSLVYGIKNWYGINYEGDPITWYQGRIIDSRYDIVIGFAGGVQIELIEPKDAIENAYNMYLDEKGEGLHHLGYSVVQMEKYLTAAEKAGISILQEGEFPMKGNCTVKTTYLDTGEKGGIVTELMSCRLYGMPWPVGRILPTKMGCLTGAVKHEYSDR